VKRAGDIISALFDEGFMEKAGRYSALFSCWKDLTEKNGIAYAADHSWIKSMEKGLVWIEVDHPGWKQVLQTKQSKLLSDFCRRFPDMDISGISISLCRPGARPWQAEEQNEADRQKPPEPDHTPAEGNGASNSGYDAIKDNALKDALKRLEKNVAAREKKASKNT
jgi:hypothetical protein